MAPGLSVTLTRTLEIEHQDAKHDQCNAEPLPQGQSLIEQDPSEQHGGWRPHGREYRAALRMGTAELLTRPDVPTPVVLNEVVDLAKRFSTDDSGRFVNGLLARVATEVRPQ